MARAYAGAVIDAPLDSVWKIVREFNGLPDWIPMVTDSEIERGLDPSAVGCVRAFHLEDGTLVRERLLALDDINHTLVYNFETPAFPVANYIATIVLKPITSTNTTFAEWEAVFDEAEEDAGRYVEIISNEVFAAGWTALNEKIRRS